MRLESNLKNVNKKLNNFNKNFFKIFQKYWKVIVNSFHFCPTYCFVSYDSSICSTPPPHCHHNNNNYHNCYHHTGFVFEEGEGGAEESTANCPGLLLLLSSACPPAVLLPVLVCAAEGRCGCLLLYSHWIPLHCESSNGNLGEEGGRGR